MGAGDGEVLYVGTGMEAGVPAAVAVGVMVAAELGVGVPAAVGVCVMAATELLRRFPGIMQGSQEGKLAKLWGQRAHFGANISMKIASDI